MLVIIWCDPSVERKIAKEEDCHWWRSPVLNPQRCHVLHMWRIKVALSMGRGQYYYTESVTVDHIVVIVFAECHVCSRSARLTRRVPLVEQKLLTIPEHLSVIRVARSSVLCVCFVDRCLSFRTFSLGHCVVCSSIYRFWLPLWYLSSYLYVKYQYLEHISYF
jgi:hypothetical protein